MDKGVGLLGNKMVTVLRHLRMDKGVWALGIGMIMVLGQSVVE